MADPNTGVSVYDSTAYQGRRGWQVYGGTSASSPIVASVYALSGNVAGYPASFTWSHSSALNDVTTGLQRHLLARGLVHLGRRLGRPDRPRHAERDERLLRSSAWI